MTEDEGVATLSGERSVALVTGGRRRVGRACVEAFAREGFDVVWTSREDRSGSERAHAAPGGGSVVHVSLDPNDLDHVDRTAKLLAERLPRLDALVHNASSYDRTPLETMSPGDMMSAFVVNAAAPLLLSRGLAALMRRSASGDESEGSSPGIVALCDIHAMGEHGLPRKDFAAYSVSKAALVEVTRVLARELAPEVRSNAVAIGVVAWPETGPEASGELQERLLRSVPMGRTGSPEELARMVVWLARDAQYVTGEVVRYDGGRSMV